MHIRGWMTKDVVSVKIDTSMSKAIKLMKTHNIRRLPVVDDNMHVVGIVSDRDIKDASPSKATTLDMRELQYLLSEIKIRDIMTANPVSVSPEDTIAYAALIMEKQGYGALPVVDEEGTLVGIICEHDLYKVFIEITGVRQEGMQLEFELLDEPGTLCPLFTLFGKHNANILSILTDRRKLATDRVLVYIRLYPMDSKCEETLIEACSDPLFLKDTMRFNGKS